jgi:hypothetical protein
VSLANMRPGDFVFFVAYALAGLVPSLFSFFLTLLEYYVLQLQHLSPNSIALVAIFAHLYEMYVGVRSSARLFRCFFMLKATSPRPPLIGGYYFQRRTPGHARYITPISPGRWERWREDWALVQADVHDRLALPVGGPTLDRTEWGKDPGLEPGFDPVLDQIQYLAENGLTSLMVLHNFLSKRITPLQDRSHRPAWMYTGVNDIMWLDRGPGSSLGDALLSASLKALTTDQSSAELMTPTAACEPLCAGCPRWMMSTSLQCRGATSPAAWSFPSSVVWAAPLVVTATVATRERAVEPSPQAVVWQVAVVAPRQAVEEVAPLAVPAPLRPLARANRCVSFLMTMRYRRTRTSLCRSGCGNFPALGQPCSMRRLR